MSVKFPDKLRDLLSDDFVDAIEREGKEDLQKRVYEYRKIISDTKREQGEDTNLTNAKAEVRRLNKKYTDTIKGQQAMIEFIFHTMRDRSMIE